jgi:hypothetical protein
MECDGGGSGTESKTGTELGVKPGVGFKKKWLTAADEIRNFCLTSPIGESNQIEEMLALAD